MNLIHSPLFLVGNYGRGGKIRTCDPLVPNQMRYQAALRPEPSRPLGGAFGPQAIHKLARRGKSRNLDNALRRDRGMQDAISRFHTQSTELAAIDLKDVFDRLGRFPMI